MAQEKRTTIEIHAELTREELCERLGVPRHAAIWVRVPGGADWSNMNLDIDDKNTPLRLSWSDTLVEPLT
jgi:hypothetical protein